MTKKCKKIEKKRKKVKKTEKNSKIKKMPAKKRRSARAVLKKKLTDRVKAFLSKLPSAAKMKIDDIKRVQKIAKGIKW